MKKVFMLLLTSLLLIGGGANSYRSTDFSKDDAMEILNNADIIKVKKSGVGSIVGNKYLVSVNGEVVATISGKFIKITGDVFTLKSSNGNVISKEKQMKRWNIKFNRSARIYDEHNVTTGYINEEVFKDFLNIGYAFHFYDENKNEVGYTKQKIFTLSFDNAIYDSNGTLAYEIKGNMINFIDTEFTIYVKNKEHLIDIESVLFFTAIVNEIDKSE